MGKFLVTRGLRKQFSASFWEGFEAHEAQRPNDAGWLSRSDAGIEAARKRKGILLAVKLGCSSGKDQLVRDAVTAIIRGESHGLVTVEPAADDPLDFWLVY